MAELAFRSELSSIVFVGAGGFKPSLINTKELFEGKQDPNVTIVEQAGFAQVFFNSGEFELLMVPERLDLKCHNQESKGIVEPLIKAAHDVSQLLQPLSVGLPVSAVGWNNDFSLSSSSRTGLDFFSELVNERPLRKLVLYDQLSPNNSLKLVSALENMQISVTFEPHVASAGELLFVHVNGHTQLQPGVGLSAALRNVKEFNDYWVNLLARLMKEMAGGIES